MKISIKVKTGKKQSKVIKRERNEYIVWLSSRPIRGAANKELISLLADHFEVKKNNIHIVAGLTSSKKTVEVLG